MNGLSRKSPKDLIVNVLVFLLPFFVAAEIVCRVFLVNLVPSEVNARKSIEAFESVATNVNVLFLGNSYTYYGIDPAQLRLANGATSHNFAFAGEGIGDTYYKLEYYLRRGLLPKLKLVVINVDNYNFFGQAVPLNTAYPYSRYYDFADIYEHNRAFLKPALLSTLALYRVSLQAKTLVANRLFVAPKPEAIQPNGYSRRDYAISRASLEADTAAFTGLEKMKVYAVNPELDLYFTRLVTDLKRRHVDVVFIVVPTPAMFLPRLYAKTPSSGDAGVSGDFLEEITARTIGQRFPGVPIRNYMRDSSGFSVEMFSDRGHLNRIGARVFSAKLANDINAYLSSPGEQGGSRMSAGFN